MGSFIDITGEKFGRWTAIARTLKDRGSYWDVVCECGSSGSVDGSALRSGATLSCGCYNREVNSARKTHGGRNKPEYQIWCAMKQRCINPNHIEYPRYGARGIKLCPEWFDDFGAFYAELGDRPSRAHSIDRIDNNKDYQPRNCRWANLETQNNNKRNNLIVEYQGLKLPIFYAAQKAGAGVTARLAGDRLRNGWSVSRALETPVRPTKPYSQWARS